MTEENKEPQEKGIICIQLRTGMWQGTAPLKAEDIGLTDEQVPDKLFRLGNKRLYPPDRRAIFSSIAQRAGQYLKRQTLPHVIEQIRMAPRLRLPKILEELKKIKEEFFVERDKFFQEYPKIREEWLEENKEFREALESHYPEVNKLIPKFQFTWSVFEVRGISSKEVDDIAVLDAINEAKAEFEEQLADMTKECILVLRAKVADTVANLVDRIRGGKIIRNDTIQSVKNIYDWFKELNVFGDTDIEGSLMKLRNYLDSSVADAAFLKDNEALQNEIIKLAEKVQTAADNIEDVNEMSGRYKRVINLE